MRCNSEPPHGLKVKVKRTLVQALRLCTGRTARKGSRGIALPFLDHGTRNGWGVSVTLWPFFIPGKDPVLIVQEAGWAPGPVWIDAEISPLPGLEPRAIQPLASRYTDWAIPAYSSPSALCKLFCTLLLIFCVKIAGGCPFPALSDYLERSDNKIF